MYGLRRIPTHMHRCGGWASEEPCVGSAIQAAFGVAG